MIFIILLIFLIFFILWSILKAGSRYDDLVNFDLDEKNKSNLTNINK